MIQLEKIKITNYRNFKEFECELQPFSCLIGINGVGKSNFLKAINEFSRSSLSKATKNTEANFSDEQKIQYNFQTDRSNELVINSSFQEIRLISNYFIIEIDEQSKKLVKCEVKFQPLKPYIDVTIIVVKKIVEIVGRLEEYLTQNPKSKMAFHILNKIKKSVKRFIFTDLISNYQELLEFESLNQFFIEHSKDTPFHLRGKEKNGSSSYAFSSISQKILEGINDFISSNMILRMLTPVSRPFFTETIDLSKDVKNRIIPINNFLHQKGITDDQLLGYDRTIQINLFQELSLKLNNILSEYPQIWKDIQIKLDMAEKDQLRIIFLLNEQKEVKYSDISAGQQWFLHFIFDLYDVLTDPQITGILLIDEPGTNLHLGAQLQISNILKEFQHGSQVVYTTHMPHLIDYQNPKSVICLMYDPETRTHSINPTEIIHFKLKIAETLDIPQDIIFKFPDKLLLVEGPSDQFFLNRINHLLHHHNSDHALNASISINHYNGIGEISHICKLFDAMRDNGENVDFLLIYDDDTDEFRKQPKKNPSKNAEVQKFLTRIIKLTHPEIAANVAIEDFIPKSIFVQALNEFLSVNYGVKKEVGELLPDFLDLHQSQIISRLQHMGELSKIHFLQYIFEKTDPKIFIQDKNIQQLFKIIQEKFYPE
jgi:predicted ATP-dependent endonuclease of OLD family